MCRTRISDFIVPRARRTGRKSNAQRRAAIVAAQTKIAVCAYPFASVIRIPQRMGWIGRMRIVAVHAFHPRAIPLLQCADVMVGKPLKMSQNIDGRRTGSAVALITLPFLLPHGVRRKTSIRGGVPGCEQFNFIGTMPIVMAAKTGVIGLMGRQTPIHSINDWRHHAIGKRRQSCCAIGIMAGQAKRLQLARLGRVRAWITI